MKTGQIHKLLSLISIVLIVVSSVFCMAQNKSTFIKPDSILIDTLKYMNIHFKSRFIIRTSSHKDDMFFKDDTIYSELLNNLGKPIKKLYRNYLFILEEPYSLDGLYLINYNSKGLKDLVRNYILLKHHDGIKKHLRLTKYFYNEIDSLIRREDSEYTELRGDSMKLIDWHICSFDFQNNPLSKQYQILNSNEKVSCYGFTNYDIKNNFIYDSFYLDVPFKENDWELYVSKIKYSDTLISRIDSNCVNFQTFVTKKNQNLINKRTMRAYGNSFNEEEKVYDFKQSYFYNQDKLNRIEEKIIYKDETVENKYCFYYGE